MQSGLLQAEISKLCQIQEEITHNSAESKSKNSRQRRKSETHQSKALSVNRPKKLLSSSKKTKLPDKVAEMKKLVFPLVKRHEVPLNKRLKDVIIYLQQNRHPCTKSEICEGSHQDINDEELWKAVNTNVRVKLLLDGTYEYKPLLHHITDQTELMAHIHKHPKGSAWSELKDTYIGVENDFKELHDQNKLFYIENPDLEDIYVFPNDPSMDVKKLWFEMPSRKDDEAQWKAALKAAGFKVAERKEAKKRGPIPKSKKSNRKREIKFRRITNVHLPGLLELDHSEFK